VNRRAFLTRSAAAGMGLAAGGSFVRLAGAATYHHHAGDRPYPNLPAGTESIPQLKHVVVLMMENHSFDNTFGALERRGVDGLSFSAHGQAKNANPGTDGKPVYASAAPSTCQAGYTISQSWDASHQCWNKGHNDRFAQVCGDEAMYYYTEGEMPFYYALASVFPVCDRYFSSTMAQTYPNRRFRLGVRPGRRSAARADRPESAAVGLRHRLRHAERIRDHLEGLLRGSADGRALPVRPRGQPRQRRPDRELLHRLCRGDAAELQHRRPRVVRGL
jgi:phospholipase C